MSVSCLQHALYCEVSRGTLVITHLILHWRSDLGRSTGGGGGGQAGVEGNHGVGSVGCGAGRQVAGVIVFKDIVI